MNRIRSRVSPVGIFLLGLVVEGDVGPAWGQRIEWTRVFGSVGPEGATGLAVSGGAIYVAGDRSGGGNLFVLKYAANGGLLWTRQFGTPAFEQLNGIAADTSGNIYVVGYTEGTLSGQTSAGAGDAFVRKYDPNGTEIWTRQFGTPDFEGATAVAVDAGGNTYVVGSTSGAFPGYINPGPDYSDAFIRKYSPSGSELWTRQFGGPDSDGLDAVEVDSGGSVYVAGGLQNFRFRFLRKYTANGSELWTHQIGGLVSGALHDIAVDASGSIYVAGTTCCTPAGPNSSGSPDAFVGKYDAIGNELWTRRFGAPARWDGFVFHSVDDSTLAVAVDGSGVVYVAGRTWGRLPGQLIGPSTVQAFVRQYEADGTERWTYQFSSPALDVATAAAVDAAGSIYLAGSASPTPGIGSQGDSVLTKLTVPCSSVPGDANVDCLLGCQDLAVVKSAFGARRGQVNWYPPADVVADNRIDVRDLAFISQKLTAGTTCP